MVLSIGQVSEITGLSVHALRYYEREGLLADPIRRDPGGRRVYTDDDLEWLDMCIMLRATGMPLTAIRRYTDLVKAGDGNAKERVVLLRSHEERVTAQMDRLNRCLDLIRFKIARYEDTPDDPSTPTCYPAPTPTPTPTSTPAPTSTSTSTPTPTPTPTRTSTPDP
jgi:DNA-binding transcriptional MerR regulator